MLSVVAHLNNCRSSSCKCRERCHPFWIKVSLPGLGTQHSQY